MLDKLLVLLENTNIKNIGNALKKDPELLCWVKEKTSHILAPETITERIFVLVNDIHSNICDRGNKLKFKSYNAGYGYCGPAGKCECAREQVSKKVSTAKAKLSQEQKDLINSRRVETNLQKYGVTNTGQTEFAKSRHKETYEDINRVEIINQKHKNTMQERYGVENISQIPDVIDRRKHTNIQRYGYENPMQSPDIIQKAISTKQTLYTDHYLAKKNYSRFVQMVRENFNLIANISPDEYVGIKERPEISFTCVSCNRNFRKRFDYASLPRCVVCFPPNIEYKSQGEKELLNFVQQTYTGPIISGDRSIINPYEIDIFLPELKLGIEYCGLYWHSELSGKKSWNYHYRKWSAADKKGITLFTIYDDEWLTKRSIVEELIAHKLKKVSSRIGARLCDVSLLDKDSATAFFDQYHLLGSPSRLSVIIGLSHNNDIVAAMGFVNEGGDVWRLSRYASKGAVIGGASKLLKYFSINYKPKSVISFSDNRYSNGDLYKTLGFIVRNEIPPMQQYVQGYTTRFDKRSLNKTNIAKLYPDVSIDDTEWNILQKLKFDRIWDCGKICWKKDYT
jgi:hypothetical protein